MKQYLNDYTVKSANHFIVEIDEVLAEQSKATIAFSESIRVLKKAVLQDNPDAGDEPDAMNETHRQAYDDLCTSFEKQMNALRLQVLEMLIATSAISTQARPTETLDEIRAQIKNELQDQMLAAILDRQA